VPQITADSSIARLRTDATLEQAEAEGTSIARAQPRSPIMDVLWGKGGPVQVRMRPFITDMTSRVQPAVLLVFAAVACLLIIGCANAANLLLARSLSRERKVAVRIAIGAGRGRLLRQFLTESLVTSSIGGVLGVALAFFLVRALPAFVPRRFPRVDDVHVDALMLAIACGLTLMSGVCSGVAPMLRCVGADVLSSLRKGAGSSPGPRPGLIRQILLTGEAALAVMLLVVALLVGRSLASLVRVDAGYDPGRVVTARVHLPGAGRGRAETDAFVPELLDRVRAVPGVVAAGAGGMAPFSDLTMSTPVTVPVAGRSPVTAVSRVYVISPGYAETLQLRLRAGRFFTQGDLASATQMMVVNEAFVRTFLQGAEPVGFVTDSFLTRGVRAEVVGVVGNVLKDGPRTAPLPEVYVVPAHRYSLRSEIHLLARTTGDPEALMRSLPGLVQGLRADAAIDTVTTLDAQASESIGTERLATTALTGLAAFAVLLAAVGLYGVLSQMSPRARASSACGPRSAPHAGGSRGW
jgi:predicted permease